MPTTAETEAATCTGSRRIKQKWTAAPETEMWEQTKWCEVTWTAAPETEMWEQMKRCADQGRRRERAWRALIHVRGMGTGPSLRSLPQSSHPPRRQQLFQQS